jgi:acyl carrier protein
LIQLKTVEMAEPVLAPKLVGARVLERVTAGLDLDFFVVFSSLTAIAGGVGQVDTCAAGAFLDAFAHARADGGARFTGTVNWGPFEWDAWDVPSLTVGEPADLQIKSTLQASGIGAAALGAALDRVLCAGRTQIAVCSHDLDRVMEQTDAMTVSKLSATFGAARLSSSHVRPQLTVTYVRPRTATEQTVAAVWAESFGLDAVGVHDGFFDLSGNSLLAIQIITRLRLAFDVDLSMTALFETPTVEGLAQQLDRLRGLAPAADGIEALLDEIEGLSPSDVEARLGGAHDARVTTLPGSDAL